MKRRRLLPVLVPFLTVSPLPTARASQQPFQPAETAAAAVYKRQQNACPANLFSCADHGTLFQNICCPLGQLCATDASNQPACCPAGAVCTGTAPSTFVAPTAVSYVPNPYFSFPYITTSFANAGACSAAVSQCSANSAVCATNLQGGAGQGFGVTIVVPGGGGTTVAPTAAVNVGPASATSICASLSSQACFGIQNGVCTPGGGGGTFVVGNRARPTAMPCAVVAGAVAAGVGFGVMI